MSYTITRFTGMEQAVRRLDAQRYRDHGGAMATLNSVAVTLEARV
ncbi:hypothetical protein MKX50_00230 [Paenibacillus sp. FSL W8-0186]